MIVRARPRDGRSPFALAIVALILLGSPVRAGNITGIVSFGDGLSDVGNTYLAAGIPASPLVFTISSLCLARLQGPVGPETRQSSPREAWV